MARVAMSFHHFSSSAGRHGKFRVAVLLTVGAVGAVIDAFALVGCCAHS